MPVPISCQLSTCFNLPTNSLLIKYFVLNISSEFSSCSNKFPFTRSEVKISDSQEILLKGPSPFLGYYKDPEKTAETIKDGWLKTGDLGRLTVTGELQITGRAKDTIVLIGGENIEPVPIEEKLLENKMINQVMVVGQDRKNLGALIVPEKDNIMEFALKNNVPVTSYEELLKQKEIIEEIGRILKITINTKNGFKDFERITFFSLLPNTFEIGEELTSMIKMKRNYIAKKFADKINEMYGS